MRFTRFFSGSRRAVLAEDPGTRNPRLGHHDASSVAAKMLTMRTTVTLDDDVAAQVREVARERGLSFKEALNSALRAGLSSARSSRTSRYRVPVRDLGLRPGVNLDKALQLAGQLEDDEVVRKLELRK